MDLKIYRFFCGVVFGSLMLFLSVSCTSPENDGTKMAEKANDCAREYLNDMSKLSSQFVSDFDESAYITRADAKKAYWTAAAKVFDEYSAELDRLKGKEAEIEGGYGSNYEAKAKYSDAYARTFDPNLAAKVYQTSASEQLPDAVSRRISSFVPARPDELQIQKDLVGHSISEGVVPGYYSSSWKWNIEQGEISNFAIKEVLADTRSEYEFIASMRLTSKVGKAFDAEVKVRYILPETDDWKIEFTHSQGMHIVKTGKYDDCIRVEKKGWYYDLCNSCDILLEVGGVEYFGEWKKFSIRISPHERESLFCSDYRIDYVELP